MYRINCIEIQCIDYYAENTMYILLCMEYNAYNTINRIHWIDIMQYA